MIEYQVSSANMNFICVKLIEENNIINTVKFNIVLYYYSKILEDLKIKLCNNFGKDQNYLDRKH